MNPEIVAETGAARAGKSGFWRRQFNDSPRPPQVIFDVIFGIAGPIICFLLDPGIVKGQGYSPFIYGLSALAIAALGLWLGAGQRMRARAGPVSGVLLAGAIFCLLIGVVILPLSLFGLMVGERVSVLGFTPLVTTFVYARNTIRSFRHSRAGSTRSRSVSSLVLTCALVIVVPGLANWGASRVIARSIDQIRHGDQASTEGAVRRLRYLNWCADLDQIVFDYGKETDPIRKERVAAAYKRLTGQDVESRLRQFRD